MLQAHVDDEAHTQVVQTGIILHGRRGADEEVGGDGVKIHAGHLTANADFVLKVGEFYWRMEMTENTRNPNAPDLSSG